MSYKEIIQFLKNNKGYLKRGSKNLSLKFSIEEDVCKKALKEVKEHEKSLKEMQVSKMWKMPNSDKWGVSLQKSSELTHENIDNIIKTAFKEIKFSKLNINKLKSNSSLKNSLLVFLSDQHIGANTGEGLYNNKYDYNEVVKRLSVLTTEIHTLKENNQISTVHLVLLGDSLDGYNGQTTRGGHSLPQNMTNQESLNCFFETHVNFINTLRYYFSKIKIHLTCNSNHGGDFEYAAHKMLDIYFKNIKEVETKMYTKFLGHFYLNDYCYIITHGKDKINRKTGLPKYLDTKTEMFIQQYITANKITGKIRVVKGDLHVDTDETGKLFSYRNVPSFFGSSDWIMDNFGNTLPGVAYDIIKENKLIKGVIDLI